MSHDPDDFDDDDDACFMCGGVGSLSDECACEEFEDTCCCAAPTPRTCPECRGTGLLRRPAPIGEQLDLVDYIAAAEVAKVRGE